MSDWLLQTTSVSWKQPKQTWSSWNIYLVFSIDNSFHWGFFIIWNTMPKQSLWFTCRNNRFFPMEGYRGRIPHLEVFGPCFVLKTIITCSIINHFRITNHWSLLITDNLFWWCLQNYNFKSAWFWWILAPPFTLPFWQQTDWRNPEKYKGNLRSWSGDYCNSYWHQNWSRS